MLSYKQFISELSTPQATTPATVPGMTQHNPVYSHNQQQYKPNRGASPVPNTVTPTPGWMTTVAKILDPTGILSYEDIPPAMDAFNKEPTPFNAFMMLLSITAVIPLAGKIAAPLKIAAKAGQYDRVIQLTPYISKKIVELMEKNAGNIAKLNIPAETIQKAKQMVQSARAEDMIPAHVFKQMISDFKATGGKITKAAPGDGSYYDAKTKTSPATIAINPAGRTRATFAHEWGHHQAMNAKPGAPHHRHFDHATYLDRLNATSVAHDVGREREANTFAIQQLKQLGATPQQIAMYHKTMGPAFKTYKMEASRNISLLANKMARIMDLPNWEKQIKDILSGTEQIVLAKPGVGDQLKKIAKVGHQHVDQLDQHVVLMNKLIDQELKQQAAARGGISAEFYQAYRKALSTPDQITPMLKPAGVSLP